MRAKPKAPITSANHQRQPPAPTIAPTIALTTALNNVLPLGATTTSLIAKSSSDAARRRPKSLLQPIATAVQKASAEGEANVLYAPYVLSEPEQSKRPVELERQVVSRSVRPSSPVGPVLQTCASQGRCHPEACPSRSSSYPVAETLLCRILRLAALPSQYRLFVLPYSAPNPLFAPFRTFVKPCFHHSMLSLQ